MTIPVSHEADILSALKAHGMELPDSLCHQGNCLSCIGQLLAGDVNQATSSFYPAHNGPVATKFILLCRAFPCSDCTIKTYLLN
ncbi:2Fe-2S iron-sulfur cluster-binding protein [Leptolyngbya sp. 'hensonii']|uniref:2Fe-2S iron-sulfur cluster-binding protein n=1 Tax=Leptolyngbya sp. 'hensonii' TaxID=1922337 RepID=UPI0015C5602D|nr:2Fe-2S iron-sulfur cluster-binding protein [Leptolyngbya sp. 'hensonii']